MLGYDRSLLLLLLLHSCVDSCKNFLAQHCTDIPIGFRPISSIKCVQLVPTRLDSSVDYTVDNYIIQKAGDCYSVLPFNPNLPTLFSSECRELCSEQYCLLFESYSNRSVINVFYSSTFNYLSPAVVASQRMPSYDYAMFDECSSASSSSKMLIIVYVLCGIVGVLTVGVLLKYLISCILKRKEPGYDPWSWRWLVDTLLCRRRPDNQPQKGNEGEHRVDAVYTVDDDKKNDNPLQLTLNHRSTPSATQITSGTGSSPRVQGRKLYTSSNSAGSEKLTPNMSRHVYDGYVDFAPNKKRDNSSAESKNDLRPLPQPLLEKLSSKASAAYEAITGQRERPLLESEASIGVINIRL